MSQNAIKSKEKTKALVWGEKATLALKSFNGKPVISRLLQALQIPGIEAIGLLLMEKQKQMLQTVVPDSIDWLIFASVSDFGQSVLWAEDWFKGFEGNVVLILAGLPFIDAPTIRALIQCQSNGNSVGCLPLVSTKPIGQNWQVEMDNYGKIRRLNELEPNKKGQTFTAFPWCVEWDCLQRALYQVGTQQGTYPLRDIVEKATDNGFEVDGIPLKDEKPFWKLSLENENEILNRLQRNEEKQND